MVWFVFLNPTLTFGDNIMLNLSSEKNNSVAIKTIAEGTCVHTFLINIRQKMIVIARLEFELDYYYVTVQHISLYTTRTPSPLITLR